MRRFKCFLNYEKEERWLEYMASQGYQLKKAGFGYSFESVPPEQTNMKIDYRIFKREQDFLDYCSLFEDCGWRHIAGTKNSGTQYFKKDGNGGDEDIFSDAVSRAGRYKRLSDMWLAIFVAFFPMIIILMSNDSINTTAILNPKELYYTPGLWEMSGFDFWRRFLFETPFALLRGFSWLIMLLCILLYLVFYFKSRSAYKKTLSADER